MALNDMKIEILEDGRIRIETGSFNQAVHSDAEKFVAEIERLSGGEVKKEKKKESTHHHHNHVHGHHHHKH